MRTPTEITFWTWVPGIEAEVELFEKAYPAIDVEVVNVGGGGTQYQKLRSALKAGRGGPDVAQIEYQHLSSFRVTDGIANLEPFGARDLAGDYADWVWSQVADVQGVWAIPQDSGPIGHLYRKDLFDQAGIDTPPETWDDYRADAQEIRDSSDSYISNLAPNDPGQFVSFFWQAGAKPFDYDGAETVTIDLDSPEVTQVVDYWNQMIADDLVSVDPDFNYGFYQGLSSGKYAGWLTAAWAPVFLQGTVANTAGKWRVGRIPQWNAGEDVSGNWGGSTDVVLSTSQHKIAAYKLAEFINHDQESTLKFANEQFLFPTKTDTLDDEEFLDQEADFYGGQQVNKLFADISTTVDPEFSWLPFMEFVYSSYNETLGAAIAERRDLNDGLRQWEAQITDYAQQQGFTVK